MFSLEWFYDIFVGYKLTDEYNVDKARTQSKIDYYIFELTKEVGIMDRMYQNDEFVCEELNGLRIERVITCMSDDLGNVIILYLQVETLGWFDFFIDVGIAFMEKIEEIEEDDSYIYLDRTQELEVVGLRVKVIYCQSVESSCRLTIALDNGVNLILQSKDMSDYESDVELVIASSLLNF